MCEQKDTVEEHARNLITQERMLKLVGVWPGSDNDYMSTGRWIFALLTQISTIYSLSLEIYRHCLGVDDAAAAFVMNLSTVISLSKLFILRLNWKHIYALINLVTIDWSTVDDSCHEHVMKEYFKKGRIVSLMMLYLGSASGVSFVIRALPLKALLSYQMFENSANSSRNSPNSLRVNYFLTTYCTFGTLPLPYHVCVLVLQGFQIFVNVVAHCGNDGLFFGLTMHLCGQFEILKMKLAKIKFEEFSYRKEKIGFLVKRHCQLAVLTNDLEQGFNTIILAQLLMSATLICVEGFLFLICLNTGDNAGAVRNMAPIATLLLQLYLYAYAGDTLESRTEEIAQAAYESLWYRSRGHTAKDLILIINRGNSPYHVTAGKFVLINIFTFKDILKTSASYLSVLRAILDT